MLVPQMAAVLKEFPELRFELLSSVGADQLADADFAIQFEEPHRSPRRTAIALGSIHCAVFVVSTHSMVNEPSTIPWVTCQGWPSTCRGSADTKTKGSEVEPSQQRILVDDPVTQLSCVYSGLGKCILPLGVGMHDPKLVRLDSEESVLSRELWLSCQAEYLNTPRAQVCARWLERCVSIFNAH